MEKFEAKKVTWETVRNIANSLTNQLYLALEINQVDLNQAHLSEWHGGPIRNFSPSDGHEVKWLDVEGGNGWYAFNEEDVDALYWTSSSSGNSLEAIKKDPNQWELTYAPSPSDPNHRGVYFEMYNSPESVQNLDAEELYKYDQQSLAIVLANKAKEIIGSDYSLPNVVFAYLLGEYFRGSSELKLSIETQDPDGNNDQEGYFDLMVIKKGGGSLCIPVPLLDQCSLVTAMKSAEIFQRKIHEREKSRDSAEMQELWEKLLGEIPRETLVNSLRHLSKEKRIEIPILTSIEATPVVSNESD